MAGPSELPDAPRQHACDRHTIGVLCSHTCCIRSFHRRERESTATALSYSWSLKTSGQWSPLNPARGQCNVTALLLNELFGGEILKTPLPEGDRFYIRVGGERVDLTDSQFAAAVIYLDIAPDRSEALAGTSVSEYEALRATFIEHFKSCE